MAPLPRHARPAAFAGRHPLLLIAPALIILLASLACQEDRGGPTRPGPDLTVSAVVFAPHPDDETIAFGGLIYQLVHAGQSVKVVVVTDGDAYFDACAFWKNGCPRGADGCGPDSASSCSPAEMAAFGLVRRSESKRATALLGLPARDLTFLGYPDGTLEAMYNHPDSLVGSNSSRALSETGRAFRGANLLADLKDLLRSYPRAALYTTHPADHHRDHRTLPLFLELARTQVMQEQAGEYPIYWAVVHDPGSIRDLQWPLPACTWDPDWSRREERYDPTSLLTTPPSMAEQGRSTLQDRILWDPAARTPPLLREALDCYESQGGFVLRNGGRPAARYLGCLDASGLLLAFVKRNYLLWSEPGRGPEPPAGQ